MHIYCQNNSRNIRFLKFAFITVTIILILYDIIYCPRNYQYFFMSQSPTHKSSNIQNQNQTSNSQNTPNRPPSLEINTPKNFSPSATTFDKSPSNISTSGIKKLNQSKTKEDQNRYAQLVKMHNQLKDKQQDLLSKQAQLNKKIAEFQELNKRLNHLQTQLVEKRKNNDHGVNNQIVEYQQKLNNKKQAIQLLEKQINDEIIKLKQKATTQQANTSSTLRQVNSIDSKIALSTKQLNVAQEKLKELQEKKLILIKDLTEQQLSDKIAKLSNQIKQRQQYRKTIHTSLNQIENQYNKLVNLNIQQSKKFVEQKKRLQDHISNTKNQVVVISQTNQGKILQLKQKISEQNSKYLNNKTRIEQQQKILQQELLNLNQQKQKLIKQLKQKSEKVDKSADIIASLRNAFTEKENDKNISLSQQSDLKTKIISADNEIQKLKIFLKQAQQLENNPIILNPSDQNKKINRKKQILQALKNTLRKLQQQQKNYKSQIQTLNNEYDKLKNKKNDGKELENQQLRNSIQKLENNIADEKQKYNQLQILQKNYVPEKLLKQYKSRCIEQKQNVQKIRIMEEQSRKNKKQIQQMQKIKQIMQWQKNQTIARIQNQILTKKTRIQQLQIQNKDFNRKIAQNSSKFNQYKQTYPDFQIPKQIPKQVPKKNKGKQTKKLDQEIPQSKIEDNGSKKKKKPIEEKNAQQKKTEKNEKVQEKKIQKNQKIQKIQKIQKVEKVQKPTIIIQKQKQKTVQKVNLQNQEKSAQKPVIKQNSKIVVQPNIEQKKIDEQKNQKVDKNKKKNDKKKKAQKSQIKIEQKVIIQKQTDEDIQRRILKQNEERIQEDLQTQKIQVPASQKQIQDPKQQKQIQKFIDQQVKKSHDIIEQNKNQNKKLGKKQAKNKKPVQKTKDQQVKEKLIQVPPTIIKEVEQNKDIEEGTESLKMHTLAGLVILLILGLLFWWIN